MKYRKKPVVIEAEHWDGSAENAIPIINWILKEGGIARFNDVGMLYIDTLEGTMLAQTNDYIIQGVQGEFYPCKPSIFETTYEVV